MSSNLVFGLEDLSEGDKSLTHLLNKDINYNLGDTVRTMLQRNISPDKLVKIEGISPDFVLDKEEIAIEFSLSEPDPGFYYLDKKFFYTYDDGTIVLLSEIVKLSDGEFASEFKEDLDKIKFLMDHGEEVDHNIGDFYIYLKQGNKMIAKSLEDDETYLIYREQIERLNSFEKEIVPFEEFLKN